MRIVDKTIRVMIATGQYLDCLSFFLVYFALFVVNIIWFSS